jgi:hypothetical protein
VLRRNRIPGVCVLVASLTVAAAQQLSVKSATAKAVQLEWTGATGSASLERSSGQTFQRIGPGDAGKYTDTGIDAFGTYKYRINTGGKLSNEVTVGPPAAGVSNAAPAPKGSAYENYGPATAIGLDENGDPVIAFEWVDPNGDGDKADTEIRFVRWDRASYQWTKPVRVVTTGPIADQGVNAAAVGCDRSSGTLAMLAAVGDALMYAVSSDRGATWKSSPVNHAAGTPHSVAMALTGGQAYAAVNGEDSAVYLTGSVADSSSWKPKPIPAGEGWKVRNSSNIALTLDGSGKPALAFYEDQQEGDVHRYVFWRPTDADPIVVTSDGSSDSPDVALTYGGHKFGVLIAVQLANDDSGHVVCYSQSADGSSWSKPSKLPIDGPRSTNPPLGIALDSKDAITAAFGSNSGSAAATCNFPAVSRSADGSSWKTCGPGKAAGADFNPEPSTLHVMEAPNDKAYVLWQEPSETKYGPGVLIWHER